MASGIDAKEVEWLSPFMKEKFFEIQANFSLHDDLLYKTRQIIGTDAASVAAVWALQIEPGMRCIDTCCAPGMKMSIIKDVLGDSGTVIGLDVNEQRLDVCYNLFRNFGYSELLKHVYKVKPDWNVTNFDEFERFDKFRMRRKKGSRKFRLKKQKLETDSESGHSFDLQFDRVLVDAQCTHDGSERHNQKHALENGFWQKHSKSDKSRSQYDTDEKLEALISLQKRLILNGFRMLAPNGLMVYSTCSLQREQNQDVVEYLFDEVGAEASPGTLPFNLIGQSDKQLPRVPATRVNSYSCLFEPGTSGTSGQYIAVIRKNN
jgi:16S rRNA C967 or C1407 C5-methylase (RsmB/RsmF family)